MKRNLIAILTAGVSVWTASAQVLITGQSGAHLLQSAAAESPRTIDSGHPLFGWESLLFLDASPAENIGVLITLHASEGREIAVDQAAIRLTGLTPLGLNLQAGKFYIPFGNLGERRFPRRNPLFGLPLIYEYRTALPNRAISESDLLAGRGKGAGMRLLNLGMYDLGAMLYGSVGILDYAVSVTNGTVSSVSYDGGTTNSDVGKIIRLAITPFTGLTLGGAYAWGAYLDDAYPSPYPGTEVREYVQKAAEVDLEFSRGHFVFAGEGVYSRWPVPYGEQREDFDVFGYSLEARFTIIPRLYAALRVGGLQFGEPFLSSPGQQWDYDVTEWEGGLGYFLDRDVVVKLVRRETRIRGGGVPDNHLTVLQLAVAY